MTWIVSLVEEARDEAYKYFDQNIRTLDKNPDGSVSVTAENLVDNDIDAFRHAYVSGVFVIEYNARVADILGQLNELKSYGSPYPSAANQRNMDLWNNAVGRRLAKGLKSRRELVNLVHAALKTGDLITDLFDEREYEGDSDFVVNPDKPVVVLKESRSGRNEFFVDLATRKLMTRDEFVGLIKAGKYSAYQVKMLKGVPTPVSKPNSRGDDNLE